MITTPKEMRGGKWDVFGLVVCCKDVGEERAGVGGGGGISEGPSLLCAGVRGEGGGLWRHLAAAAAAVFSA